MRGGGGAKSEHTYLPFSEKFQKFSQIFVNFQWFCMILLNSDKFREIPTKIRKIASEKLRGFGRNLNFVETAAHRLRACDFAQYIFMMALSWPNSLCNTVILASNLAHGDWNLAHGDWIVASIYFPLIRQGRKETLLDTIMHAKRLVFRPFTRFLIIPW